MFETINGNKAMPPNITFILKIEVQMLGKIYVLYLYTPSRTCSVASYNDFGVTRPICMYVVDGFLHITHHLRNDSCARHYSALL